MNDATRELGSTLGVAVVGSIFSSVFGARLAEGAFAAMPDGRLEQARDSVAVAMGFGHADPALLSAAQDSFMAGLHTACLLVAGVCFVGAIAAVIALPGRRFVPRGAAEPKIDAREPAAV